MVVLRQRRQQQLVGSLFNMAQLWNIFCHMNLTFSKSERMGLFWYFPSIQINFQFCHIIWNIRINFSSTFFFSLFKIFQLNIFKVIKIMNLCYQYYPYLSFYICIFPNIVTHEFKLSKFSICILKNGFHYVLFSELMCTNIHSTNN